ncbi:hypothetical protein M422DRAFT_270360 [Sphaerobolus stellatus SS14]|uniref:Uncharacterized protein n=1 Tax=Sphaerobolus stellatus (strain SS14) TaxID=990650 RepID=A0A0C9UT40_SPHS4|nr:hypothetical protein M422DRAFT_270360 [Sphaerobolus stellatus SS14]
MSEPFNTLPCIVVGIRTEHGCLRTIQELCRNQCNSKPSSESSVTMTSQACHWLTVFATLAVWRTRCSCELALAVTDRLHKKILSHSTLHAKSMRSTAESRSLPTPLRAAPATMFSFIRKTDNGV